MTSWPIWYCIRIEVQQTLVAYQWKWHRKKLRPPSYIGDIETPPELEKIMKEKPKGVLAGRGG